MAGNSQRRGATRKPGSKKGAQVGSGGVRRRGLEGRGPTPKAEDRPYHAAYRRKTQQSKANPPTRPNRRATLANPDVNLIVGRNAVLEALRASVPVEKCYVASRIEADERTREILALIARRNYPVVEVGRSELDTMTGNATHQGIALVVPPYAYAHPADLIATDHQSTFIVALDGVTDPHNLGAVVRSAAAFGAHGVVIPERRSAGVTAAAWKVSAGALARVPVARATNLSRALDDYRRKGVFVVGLDADGSQAIADVDLLGEPIVLVVGSEGKGLSRIVREKCDVVAAIPITQTMESLNASVATGIALYEVARHRAM